MPVPPAGIQLQETPALRRSLGLAEVCVWIPSIRYRHPKRPASCTVSNWLVRGGLDCPMGFVPTNSRIPECAPSPATQHSCCKLQDPNGDEQWG